MATCVKVFSSDRVLVLPPDSAIPNGFLKIQNTEHSQTGLQSYEFTVGQDKAIYQLKGYFAGPNKGYWSLNLNQEWKFSGDPCRQYIQPNTSFYIPDFKEAYLGDIDHDGDQDLILQGGKQMLVVINEEKEAPDGKKKDVDIPRCWIQSPQIKPKDLTPYYLNGFAYGDYKNIPDTEKSVQICADNADELYIEIVENRDIEKV